jgi:transposase-like protein
MKHILPLYKKKIRSIGHQYTSTNNKYTVTQVAWQTHLNLHTVYHKNNFIIDTETLLLHNEKDL